MQYMKIGHSDLNASVITLGSWAIGGGASWRNSIDDESVAAVHTALDNGINIVDTAPIYGLGHSEEMVGKAISTIKRSDILISTKATFSWDEPNDGIYCYDMYGHHIYKNMSYDAIKRDCEESLKRLGTDYIDLYYIHNPAPDPEKMPAAETARALMDLKKEGKIRAIGASNVTSDIIRGYCKYGQLDVIQEKYSLLTRRIEKQLLPTCKELGVSVQAYSPLEQGLLTGKVTMDTTYPEGSTRNTNPCFQPTRRAQALELLAKWSDLTEKYDCTMAQLVIAMTARMIPGLHVLCGARKPEQVLDNAGAMHIKLDGADAVRMKWDVDAIS